MTSLQKNALGTTAIPVDCVEKIYAASKWDTGRIKRLCESHERLRAEVVGAEILMKDHEKVESALRALLDREDEPCRYDHNNFCQSHYCSFPCLISEAQKAIRYEGKQP